MKGMNKKKSVQFSDRITVILIPYGECMTMALDRYRFKRRIDNMLNILSPILEKHLQTINTQTEVDDS